MTETMELPKLDFNENGYSNASKWLGDDARFEIFSSDGDWGFYAMDGDREAGFNDRAEAEAAAQEAFESRLQEPMGFEPAMQAVARGCEVVGNCDGFRYSFAGGDILYVSSDIDKTMEHAFFTREMLNQAYVFYFPPKKQERVEAKAVHKNREQWDCVCGESFLVDSGRTSANCPECHTELKYPSRPEGA